MICPSHHSLLKNSQKTCAYGQWQRRLIMMFTAQALTHNNTHTTSGSPSTRKFGTFSSFLFLIFPALGSESQDFCLLNCVTAGRKKWCLTSSLLFPKFTKTVETPCSGRSYNETRKFMWYSHDNHHSAKEGSYNFHGCAFGISASPSGDLLSFLDDKVILFFKPEFTYVAS